MLRSILLDLVVVIKASMCEGSSSLEHSVFSAALSFKIFVNLVTALKPALVGARRLPRVCIFDGLVD